MREGGDVMCGVRWRGRRVVSLWCVFFFQAEDGIRDLVRSRGLGDVYKRQLLDGARWYEAALADASTDLDPALRASWSVSYTHLTLPTSDLV